PALIVLAIGADPTWSLVLSQVVLSLRIPFAMTPLLGLTMARSVMGRYANSRGITTAAIAASGLITALNVRLLVLLALGLDWGWNPERPHARLPRSECRACGLHLPPGGRCSSRRLALAEATRLSPADCPDPAHPVRSAVTRRRRWRAATPRPMGPWRGPDRETRRKTAPWARTTIPPEAVARE